MPRGPAAAPLRAPRRTGGVRGEPPAPGIPVRAVTSPEPAGDLQRHRSLQLLSSVVPLANPRQWGKCDMNLSCKETCAGQHKYKQQT